MPECPTAMIDLLSLHPPLTPDEVVNFLRPGPRFKAVSFGSYQADPAYPSQAQVSAAVQQFVQGALKPADGWRFLKAKPSGQGLYLDGGFGVGKTHLLASAYHLARAAGARVAMMSFQDLMFVIGLLGLAPAISSFRGYALLLIDEFELDDPGNTHLANTFLGQVMPAGSHVIATSNTEPGALGQGRFNAEDFQRQIRGIAERFKALTLDGPDYRQRGLISPVPLSEAEFETWLEQQDELTTATLTHRELNRHLLNVHPSHFARLLQGLCVGLRELCALPEQQVALRFVHFVDKWYDSGSPGAFYGAELGMLFHETYRYGAYAKKYSRALSRLCELLQEARTELSPSAPAQGASSPVSAPEDLDGRSG